MVRGSSPLARGLLRHAPVDKGIGRIIPARAGFTTYFHNLAFDGSDHPRSRGVYLCITFRPHRKVGSSPLARGLLRDDSASLGGERIIPARAGFTQTDRPGA